MDPVVRRAVSVVTIAAFTVQSTACHSWKPQQDPAPLLAPDAGTKQVRVQLSDGTSQVLQHPRLEADTLVGFSVTGADTTEARIAWAQVTRVETRKGDAAKTTGLAGGIVLAAAVPLLLLGSLIALMVNSP